RVDYCMTSPGEARTGLRLTAALWFYWIGCGFVRDGRYWLGRALTADTAPSPERARALWTAGWIAFLQGEHAASTALLEQARDLAEQLGDERALTYATLFLGNTAAFGANLEEGLALMAEARARLGRSGRGAGPGVLFGAVEHLWQRIGRPLVAGEPLVAWSEQAKARVLGDLGGRAYEAARKQGAQMRQDDVIAYALREKAAADEPTSAAAPQLTRREQEVAGLVTAGLSNKDIASRLVISQRTAEGHIEHIL